MIISHVGFTRLNDIQGAARASDVRICLVQVLVEIVQT
jgi:hypothetical protein